MMSRMHVTRIVLSAAAALSLLTAVPVAAQSSGGASDEAPKLNPTQVFENFTMRIAARVQVRYTHDIPDAGDGNGSFGIRRARFALSGAAYERFRYAVQLELPGGTGPRLIDANIQVPVGPATLWFGQGKAFFGRQQLNSSGNLNFVDRTIVDGRFSAGRQQGVALIGSAGSTLELNAGIYNGNGINSANANTKYMTVARAVWTPLGSYSPAESAFDYPESPRVALGVSVLNNPVGTGDDEINVTRFNTEAAFKLRGLNVAGELYQERADPELGARIDTRGWYAQAGYLLPNRQHELAARYAVISPDAEVDADEIETGVSYSYYINRHSLKVQTDFRNIERRLPGTTDQEVRLQFQVAF